MNSVTGIFQLKATNYYRVVTEDVSFEFCCKVLVQTCVIFSSSREKAAPRDAVLVKG